MNKLYILALILFLIWKWPSVCSWHYMCVCVHPLICVHVYNTWNSWRVTFFSISKVRGNIGFDFLPGYERAIQNMFTEEAHFRFHHKVITFGIFWIDSGLHAAIEKKICCWAHSSQWTFTFTYPSQTPTKLCSRPDKKITQRESMSKASTFPSVQQAAVISKT